MGSKGGTSTSTVSIPPEVLAQYKNVNSIANNVAQTPFQTYSTNPNAFVAPVNQQQYAGIGGANTYATAAQPAYGAAMMGTGQAYGTTGQVAQGFNPGNYASGVQAYENPYLQSAVGNTVAEAQNVNQQQQQSLIGNAISQGAFGGDRSNIALSALENQQNLALGQTISGMENTGYQNAATNYQNSLAQQGALAAQQGALANQMGALGAGAQTAGLAGAQAQIGAGTLEQQTQQAGLSALYNQFQQQEAYPFQTTQFLANIAEGTGALSGSTTTTTQPMSFFSDRRLKHDIKHIGHTNNGLKIYTFKYNGDPDNLTHIGFMADEVEKKRPDAVGESNGYKTVDYDKATRQKRYAGGLVAEGGMVEPTEERQGFAIGGGFNGGDIINPMDLRNILASQSQMYAPFQNGGVYGGSSSMIPGHGGVVPTANLPVSHLAVATPVQQRPQSTMLSSLNNISNASTSAQNLWDKGTKFKNYVSNQFSSANNSTSSPSSPPPATPQTPPATPDNTANGLYRGGVVRRDVGGAIPYQPNSPLQTVINSAEAPQALKAASASQQQQSGLGKLAGNLGEIGGAVSGLLGDAAGSLTFLRRGGRTGYDSGGAPTDDNTRQLQEAIDNELNSAIPDRGGVVPAPGSGTNSPQVSYSPNDVKNMIVSAASRHGIDPSIPLTIAQRESNFSPNAVGDGGSSKGVFQLHQGGLSPDYPHPGLGDSFVQETGLPLTPDTTPQQIDHAVRIMSQPNGLGNWTTAYGLSATPPAPQGGVAPAPQGGVVPAPQGGAALAPQGGVVPQSGTSAGNPAPADNSGGLLNSLTNEKVIVPLLAGLGAMAGSNSRFFGGALLEGLAGGANAYENVQNQMANRGLTGAQTNVQQQAGDIGAQHVQQQSIQTANDLTNGWLNYKATTGQSISLSDYARMVGWHGMLPADGVAPQGMAGAGDNTSLQSLLNGTVNREGVTIPKINDPLSLQAYKMTNAATLSPVIQNTVKEVDSRLAQINSTGRTTDINGNMVNVPGAIGASQQANLAADQQKQAAAFQGNAIPFLQGETQVRQNLDSLTHAYQQIQSGLYAEGRRTLSGLADVIDSNHNIPALHNLPLNDSAAAYDIAIKSAAQLMTNQLMQLPSGAPKAELDNLVRQSAQPNLQPEAVRKIIVQSKAALDYGHDLYSDYDPARDGYSVPNYINNFNGGRDYHDVYMRNAEKGTPWFKGQPPAQISGPQDIQNLPSGTPFIIPSGPSKGKTGYAP